MKILLSLETKQSFETAYRIKDYVDGFKINHLLLGHTSIIKSFADELFIDCKLWDTPNTVKKVMQRIVDLGATMATVSTLNSLEVFEELQDFCSTIGIEYTSSVWELDSAKEISELNPLFIKVPSATNLDFKMQNFLCENYNGKIHVSVGMTKKAEIAQIIKFYTRKQPCWIRSNQQTIDVCITYFFYFYVKIFPF